MLGVWGATLSSALGSILAAPRVLQALARDGVLPRWLRILGKGSGVNDEPRLGTAVTLGIAIAAVCLGDLNLIAPVLTMFFLTTYMVLNVAAGIEGFLQSPSFRPTFRVHWSLSLLGAVGCIAVMLLISAVATVVAAVIVLSIYVWLQRRELKANWGDVRRGIWMAILRTGVFQIGEIDDTKNWRPHILVLSGDLAKRWPLIELASALTHNRGWITVSTVLPGATRKLVQQKELEASISEYLKQRGVQALVRSIVAPDPFEGAERLVEIYGIGPLVPNTILLGDSEAPDRREQYCQMIASLHQAQRNIVILRHNPDRHFGRYRRIEVWWGGLHANGGLMLLLAEFLQADINWRNAQIYLKLIVSDQTAVQTAQASAASMIQKLRLNATPQVFVTGGRPFYEILHESSQEADLIFIGIATPKEDFSHYYATLQRQTVGLPTIAFVLAAPEFAFTKIFTDEPFPNA